MSRSFFAINISSLPAFQAGSCERGSALMGTAVPFAWAAPSGQPPKPGGSRRKARGVDGESACQATMVPGHYTANYNCVSFDIPLFLVPLPVVQLTPRWSPFAMRHSPHQLISGRGKPPYQGPSCNSARAQGSKGGWDHSVPRRLSAMLKSRSHIQPWNWNQLQFPSSPSAIPHFTFRIAPSGTRPFSR